MFIKYLTCSSYDISGAFSLKYAVSTKLTYLTIIELLDYTWYLSNPTLEILKNSPETYFFLLIISIADISYGIEVKYHDKQVAHLYIAR